MKQILVKQDLGVQADVSGNRLMLQADSEVTDIPTRVHNKASVDFFTFV